ncbi:MAG: alpha/beta fold hydrolase [Beijerinckiaceae bacterium]
MWWLAGSIIALVAALYLWSFVVSQRALRLNPPTGIFVDVPGGRLHVRDMGPRDAPPERTVVLLHGASCNLLALTLPLANILTPNYRVIAIDRPGHGHSDRPGGRRDADPARQALLVAQALDTLGVGRAIIAAHSLAGAMALAMAMDRPDRVAGLFLIAPVSHPWPGGISWYYHPGSWPVIGPIFSRLLPVPGAALTMGVALEGVFKPQKPPANYARLTALDLLLRPANFEANAQDVAVLLAHVRKYAPRYGEIAIPVTVIFGLEDRVVWAEIHGEGLKRQIDDLHLVIHDGAGHVPHHAAPLRVVADLDLLSMRIAGKAAAAGLTRD